ncbi:MAG TPA: hypothetical protein PK294_14400 [Ignavibacteria bacterium]|nr:hypothetical protein [Ignavibacteria bacterium]
MNKLFRFSISLIFVFTFLFLINIRNISSQVITNWTSKGNGGGGALFSPSFSPHDPDELYIACDMTELFHTTNLGQIWTETDFKEMTGNNGSAVQFTNDPMIRYCINFENDLRTPYKTTNGGTSWEPLISDPTFGETYSLFCDPSNSNNILLSSYTNLYFSNNGGTSFSSKFVNGNGCYIAGALFDNTDIYVGTNSGLLVSANSGSTFSISAVGGIPGTQAMVSFTGSKQSGVVRIFCVTLGSGDVYPGVTGADFWNYQNIYSIDIGNPNWTVKSTGINSSHYPFFVSMSHSNNSVAYVAGGSDAGSPIVYKTTNGGNNWTSVLQTVNNQNVFTGWSGHGGDRGWSYGEYALGFQCSPADPNKVAITDLGFPHITTNGGATWMQSYVNPSDQNPMNSPTPLGKHYRSTGLENTSCWWLSWADSLNIFGSYSDIRGTRSTDGGNFWSFNYTGHTNNTMYQSLKHPSNGNIYGATSTVHDMYQSTYLTDARINSGLGRILFSSNKGQAWQTLHDFSHPVISIALDPNNSNKMYASVIHSALGGIFVSDNIQNGGSSTWTKLSNPPRTEGHPFNIKVLNDGTLLSSYSGRRNPSGVFTASSGIFISTNSGTTWIDRSHSGMLYWTKDVVVDHHDINQNTWYGCVFSGWGGPPNGLGGLYKTTNRGANWTRINNLDRVGSCTISPVNPNEMYMTTEVNGLWYSSNINSPTPNFSQVSSYKFRQPERIFYNPYNANEVWVTSFGNGIKKGFTNSPAISLNITAGIEGFRNNTLQISDTIKIYLRNSVSPYESIDSSQVFLNTSGNANTNFQNAIAGNYFISCHHRNALETWSMNPVIFNEGNTSDYNFTSSQSQSFGNNMILKTGVWCFYSGDVNQDGTIDLSDGSLIDNDAFNFATGYLSTDVNGDGISDLGDAVYSDNNGFNFVGKVIP